MTDAKSRSRIVHNGEVYNFRELRKRVSGKRFRTDTDAEVLLALHTSGADPAEWIPDLDGMFAFAIVSPERVLLARDPLGVKPLYLGAENGHMVFASEIKAVLELTDRVFEFPPGHFYQSGVGLKKYFSLPKGVKEEYDAEKAVTELRDRIASAVRTRLMADVPVGAFLSGGLDSSLIAALAKRDVDDFMTFAVGMEGSEDLEAARQMSEHLETRHHERVFTIEEAIEALPKIIYHLESFDCALVRSAVPNYFLAELASRHVKVALSGEGADELFAGYDYLKSLAAFNLKKELRRITLGLHNTNLQRCDRISMAHGLEVRVPLLDDLAVVDYAFRIPIQYKLWPTKSISKWILRKVAEGILPDEFVGRRKLKFAVGSGLENQLANWAEEQISDEEFEAERTPGPNLRLQSKEELAYYRMFRESFPADRLAGMVGRSASL